MFNISLWRSPSAVVVTDTMCKSVNDDINLTFVRFLSTLFRYKTNKMNSDRDKLVIELNAAA